jgi:NitT/TauT family transport system ATP-binding protein
MGGRHGGNNVSAPSSPGLALPAIRVVNLAKTYTNREQTIEALGPVTFEVEEGSFVTLVGPSGCGKSTCLRIIDGVVPPNPGSVIEIGGKVIDGPGRDRARIFQTFTLLPWKTVQANVELGLKFLGMKKEESAPIALHYLRMMGLEGFASNHPHELSGGMQQRVGIARALALDPAILLADEPFASVDALTREVLQGELLRIWRETRKTVVFVTHSIDEAVFLSDRILVLSSRPATILDDIQVTFERPRGSDTRKLPEFAELRDRIWKTLTSDQTSTWEAEPS